MRVLEKLRRKSPGLGRRVKAALAAGVLALSQVLGMAAPMAQTAMAAVLPETIHATTDKDAFANSSMPTLTGDVNNLGGTNPSTGQEYLSYATAWRTEEGYLGYCVSTLNNHRTPADGTWLTYHKNRLMDPTLAYILRHGYPFTNTIGGVTFSDADARIVTQFAFWLITDEDFNADSGTAWKVNVAVPAARSLVSDARAHGNEESAGNQFWVYTTDDGDGYQDLVLGVESIGSLKLHKSSSNEGVSGSNGCYSLEGAKYGVYSDAACTQGVGELVCDANGDTNSIELTQGTYWVKETVAGRGYALDTEAHQVTVNAGQEAVLQVSDAPQNDPSFMSIQKVDRDTGKTDPQGAGTLAGAVFEVKYYDGYYDESNLPGQATRTWYLKTDEKGRTSLQQALTYPDTYLGAGSSDFYKTPDGRVATLPLGTVTVKEVAAPEGYEIADGSTHLTQITSNGNAVSVSNGVYAGENAPVKEPSIRGGIEVSKVDAQRDDAVAEGAATLAGAEIQIKNTSAKSVVVDGTEYQPGEVVKTLVTGVDGTCATDADALPYGDYEVTESKASKGYLVNTGWKQTVQVREQGKVYKLDGHETGHLEEQVVRGDVKLVKADDATQERYAGIPFKITSQTTGESHVGVTDENGILDTSASWNAHSNNTNANDAAVNADGHTADDSKLDSDAGVWFSGATDKQVEANDSLGALPYDTYSIEELRCEANANHELVSTKVTVKRDSTTVEIGTLDDKAVNIATELTWGAEGSHTAPAQGDITLTDEVKYEGLTVGKKYGLAGELHLIGEDGQDLGVVSKSEMEFTADMSAGTQKVDFTGIDASEMGGRKLVAYEYLYDGSDELAKHDDAGDANQTVTVPKIGTSAAGDVDDEAAANSETVTIKDTVSYKGLEAGRAYTMTGTLHTKAADGSDAGVVKDAQGNEVTAKAEFTPEASDGTVEVDFTFKPAAGLAGSDVVAFESVSRGGVQYAAHADISDGGQTVHFPSVATQAYGKKTGDHDALAAEDQTVVDTVKVSNLTVGRTYKVSGTLHVQEVAEDGTVSDGGTVKDAEGNDVVAEKEFTATAAEMEVQLEFTCDLSGLAGKTVVAFEDLSRNDVRLGSHADITDEGQSVKVPRIGTTLTNAENGAQDVQAVKDADGHSYLKLTDTVAYENLIPGKEYTVTGELHKRGEDGTDQGAVQLVEQKDGEESAGNGSESGTAAGTETGTENGEGQQASGDVAGTGHGQDGSDAETDATGTDDGIVHGEESSSIAGITIADGGLDELSKLTAVQRKQLAVALEELLGEDARSNAELQAKVDNVAGQGMSVELRLVATNEDGTAATSRNLTGKWSNGAWRLYDEAGELVWGKEAEQPAEAGTTVSKTFTAEAASGSVTVDFYFDAAGLGDGDVSTVAYESLSVASKDGTQTEVAFHKDISDEGQTVRLVDLHTTATDKADGDHEVEASGTQTVVDRVQYTNLKVGQEYTVKGTLHVANENGEDTGELTDADGNAVTAEATFTPESPDGYVDVEFTFDASALGGKEVVAFEELWREGARVATHADISDEDQTVTVTEVPPTTVGSPFPQTGNSPAALALVAVGIAFAGVASAAIGYKRRELTQGR